MGCAGRPNVANYPTREIERPYTVPVGLAKWRVSSGYNEMKDEKSAAEKSFNLHFLNWETALNDSWSLLWFPAPFGVSHQFWNTENSRLGLTVAINYLIYSSLNGWKISPTLAGSYRYKATPNIGIDLSSSFTPRLSFKGGQSYQWYSNVTLGPLIQITDTVAIKPAITYAAALEQPYISSLTTDPTEMNHRIGAALNSSFSVGQQWTILPSYSYFSEKAKGWESHNLDLDFVHVW